MGVAAKYSEAHSLKGNEVQIGGVYPFRDVSTQTGERQPKYLKQGDRSAAIRNMRRTMFEPDLRWVDPTRTFEFDTTIRMLTLTSGRIFHDVVIEFYASVYPTGFCSIVFWMEFGNESIEADELIELTGIARGTKERIDHAKISEIALVLGNEYRRFANCVELCETFEADLLGNEIDVRREKQPRFIYPIVYIGSVAGCGSVMEIMKKHPYSITAVAHLWIQDRMAAKDREIDDTLLADVHPFQYGYTIVAQNCVAEYHPRELVEKASIVEKKSLHQHHFSERTYLSFLVEYPICHYYALRCFDSEVDSINTQPILDDRWPLDPARLLQLVRRLVEVSAVRERLTMGLANFKGPFLKRRSYVRRVNKYFDEFLGISALESVVQEKVKVLSQAIETGFRTLTAVFALVVSLVALVLTIARLWK